MSAGEAEDHRFHENHEKVVTGAMEQPPGSLQHAADAPLAGAEPASRSGPGLRLAHRRHGSRSSGAGAVKRAESTPSADGEFRTTVTVGELTVTGMLPAASRLPDPAQPPLGSIAVGGDVRDLSCDDALELVDALLLVVLRIDDVAEERHRATTGANRDRED